MSRYERWAPYVPVAERRRQAAREIEKLRKKGHAVAPVIIAGRTITSTFWGKAWCKNLESYHDYENRLPRGRSYVRNGSVVDLQIAPRVIQAMVSGSSMYRVEINIRALPQAEWKALCTDCSSGIDSLVELLQGRFSKGVMDRICRQDNGLFPRPSEIKFSCNCPDYASMCKHVAAVLYGVGSRLDEKPELLFLLRAVDQNDLVARLDTTALPLAKQGSKSGKLLETDDVSQLFGLDMAVGDVGNTGTKGPRSAVKSANKKPIPAKTTERRRSATEKGIGSTELKARRSAAKGAGKKPMSVETAQRHRKSQFIERLNAAGLPGPAGKRVDGKKSLK
ncbi:MAG: SWIM zinc finger family protein [Magnetococcales bacterium]|nr:SWIM zinc finger family protein [Magnetococcales bacterium]